MRARSQEETNPLHTELNNIVVEDVGSTDASKVADTDDNRQVAGPGLATMYQEASPLHTVKEVPPTCIAHLADAENKYQDFGAVPQRHAPRIVHLGEDTDSPQELQKVRVEGAQLRPGGHAEDEVFN